MSWQHGGIAYRGKEIWSAGKYFQSNKDITTSFSRKKSDHIFSSKLFVAQKRIILDRWQSRSLVFDTVHLRYSVFSNVALRPWVTCVLLTAEKTYCCLLQAWIVHKDVAPGIRDHSFVSKCRTPIIHCRGATSKKNGDLKVSVAELTKMTKKEKDKTTKHKNEYESVRAQQSPCVPSTSDLQVSIFLGTFAKFRKATISFITSCLSVCPSAWKTYAPTRRISLNLIFE